MADCPTSQCGECLPLPFPDLGTIETSGPAGSECGCGANQASGAAPETPPILQAGETEDCGSPGNTGSIWAGVPWAPVNSAAASIPSIFQMPSANFA